MDGPTATRPEPSAWLATQRCVVCRARPATVAVPWPYLDAGDRPRARLLLVCAACRPAVVR